MLEHAQCLISVACMFSLVQSCALSDDRAQNTARTGCTDILQLSSKKKEFFKSERQHRVDQFQASHADQAQKT